MDRQDLGIGEPEKRAEKSLMYIRRSLPWSFAIWTPENRESRDDRFCGASNQPIRSEAGLKREIYVKIR